MRGTLPPIFHLLKGINPMKLRPLGCFEQPHVLHRQLQEAQVVQEFYEEVPESTDDDTEVGVPHGVEHAVVLAQHVQVQTVNGERNVRFCNSHNYRVLQRSLTPGDGGLYPPPERSFISASSDLPPDGFYTTRMKVSVNGSVTANIESMTPELADAT